MSIILYFKCTLHTRKFMYLQDANLPQYLLIAEHPHSNIKKHSMSDPLLRMWQVLWYFQITICDILKSLIATSSSLFCALSNYLLMFCT